MSIRESMIAEIDRQCNRQPEDIARDLQDTYPNITIEDAQRVRDLLAAVLAPSSKAELNRLGREYSALHAELRKKYRKSGKR